MALPIRARLTLWYSSVLTLIVVALGLFIGARLRGDLVEGLDQTLAARAQHIIAVLEDDDLEPNPLPDPGENTIAQWIDARGRVAFFAGYERSSGPIVAPSVLAAARTDPVKGDARLEVGDHDEAFRYLALAAPKRRILVVAAPMELIDDAADRLKTLLALAIPVALFVSGAGGYLLASRALRPIDRITRAASSISSDQLSARVDQPVLDDEVGRLGRTLNQMLARLENSFEQQRRFAADASHELRTPLSILQAELEVALASASTPADARATLESAREEVLRMARLVDDLLTLARSDSPAAALTNERVELDAVADVVIQRLRPAADAKGVDLASTLVPAEVRGDGGRLQQLVSNLVSNAIAYTPDGGRVHVGIGRDNGWARVSVTDTGIGIPAEALPKVFDRFYRVDAARAREAGGSGLGLAICRWIAEAHGGTIEAESTEGKGSTFTASIPLA